MKKQLIPILFCSLVAFMCAASCEKYALPKLEFSRDTLQVPLEGGVFEVALTSNVRWAFDAGSIGSWISIDSKNGDGGYQDTKFPINLTVQPNEEGQERKCTVSVSSQTLTRKLVVVQDGLQAGGDSANLQQP